jgi:Leucine-rich repeat (LRR) protein
MAALLKIGHGQRRRHQRDAVLGPGSGAQVSEPVRRTRLSVDSSGPWLDNFDVMRSSPSATCAPHGEDETDGAAHEREHPAPAEETGITGVSQRGHARRQLTVSTRRLSSGFAGQRLGRDRMAGDQGEVCGGGKEADDSGHQQRRCEGAARLHHKAGDRLCPNPERSPRSDHNRLRALPISLGRLEGLSDFLYLHDNELTQLPDSLSRLQRLRYLDISENAFEIFPEVVTTMRGLIELRVTDNHLTELPAPISRLTNLRELHLRNNQLATLSDTIRAMRELRQIDLRGNPVTNLSEGLITLRRLQKLDLRWVTTLEPPQWFSDLEAKGCIIYI